MLVNEVSRQQSNLNISSKGNLIKLANLKFADKTILNKFLNTPCKVLKGNKTNAQIIKKLPFDVYLTKENEGMTLYACYKTGFTEPKSYYLTSIKEKYLNISTLKFRQDLEAFDAYKKDYGYYNTFTERIKRFLGF